MKEIEDLIAKNQTRIRGDVTTALALAIADEFADTCRAGEPIPVWAVALRNLAGKVHRYRKALEAEKSRT